MIYSGADLIRTSGQQAERMERLQVVAPAAAVSPTVPPENADSGLLRFARFLQKERQKQKGKASPSASQSQTSSNPYVLAAQHQEEIFRRGHLLNIFA